MKYLISIFFLLLGNVLYSQVAFYIKPELYTKTNTSSLHIKATKNTIAPKKDYNSYQNDLFMFTNNRNRFDGQINMGLKVGFQYKRNFFELGFSTDHTSISSTVTARENTNVFQSPSDTIIYTYSDNSFTSGKSYYRFSLDYNRLLWQNKNKTVKFSLGAGLGILFNPQVNKKKSEFDLHTFNGWIVGGTPNQHVMEHKINSYGRNRLAFNLRLSSEITFSTKKEVELFSINVSYLQVLALEYMMYHQHLFTVYDYGNVYKYMFFQFSQGSGFYFQISRKFQLYPWIPLSKKKREANKL